MSDIPSSKKIALSCFVNEGYQKYLPLLAYSTLNSYPDYSLIFFTTGKMQAKILNALSCLPQDKIIIKENVFKDAMILKHMKEQYLKSLRWVLYDKVFDDFDGVFMSDSDMIICAENPILHIQHHEHCLRYNVPISNQIRGKRERILGYQYIIPSQYFETMKPIMDKYYDMLVKKTISLGDNEKGNEWALYHMVKEAGWIESTKQRHDVGVHHGLHLGLWRTKPKKPANCITKENHKKFFNQFLNMKEDKAYQKIMKLVPLHEISFMEKSYSKQW